ncbi:MAG TPA: hypothetical protein VF377_14380, partial [Acidimicrobiia bacterium]
IEEFTAVAVDHAQRLGLLRPDGRGSLKYPHPTRTIYGDGTIVRPIYRPPKPHDYATHPETEPPPLLRTRTVWCLRAPRMEEECLLRSRRSFGDVLWSWPVRA